MSALWVMKNISHRKQEKKTLFTEDKIYPLQNDCLNSLLET